VERDRLFAPENQDDFTKNLCWLFTPENEGQVENLFGNIGPLQDNVLNLRWDENDIV
jgi:hypothetical protein